MNSISTPSIVLVSPVLVIVSVGGMTVMVPLELAVPRPEPTVPSGPLLKGAAYMYVERLPMALPA